MADHNYDEGADDYDDGFDADDMGEPGAAVDPGSPARRWQDDEDNEGAESTGGLELMALCLSRGRRLGCARYTARNCRIEVFEVPVLLGVEGSGREGWRGGGGGDGAAATSGAQCIPILCEQDIPSNLLWLVQYVRVHDPLLFLPDAGAQPLVDIAAVLGAKCSRLQAKTAFNGTDAVPRLCAMYPQLAEAEVAGRFNLNNAAMMASMAALLSYTASVRCNVGDVVERAPMTVLYVERMTAEWLQITRTEPHPCDFQGLGRAKEGLSLFSTVNYAVSAHGRALLRQWFQLPCCDRREIEQRQRVVAFFAAPQRRDALRQLRSALLKVRPTNRIFTAMRGGKATLPLFQSLLRTVKGLVAVHELLAPVAHCAEPLAVLLHSLDAPRLRFMARQIEANVYRVTVSASRRGGGGASPMPSEGGVTTRDDMAWAAYAESGGLGGGRVSFHLGVDGPLDELRLLYTRLGVTLSLKAEAAFQELSGPLRYGLSVRCVYAAPHGYLLCVDASRLPELHRGSGRSPADDVFSPEGPTDGEAAAFTSAAAVAQLLTEQHGWLLQFTGPGPDGQEVAFFKNHAMLALDGEVGDLLQRIRGREDFLRLQLEESLLKESLCLLHPAEGIAELDCLLGFAHCAIHRRWACPVTSEEPGVLDISDGWHPVLQQAIGAGGSGGGGGGGGANGGGTSAGAVASFSFRVGRPQERVNVMTGVSGSGKSAFLTAVAHIVFLAHLGSFVPAAAATVGLTSRLLACSGVMDRGSYSSFEAECLTLNRILQHCATERAEAAQRSGSRGEDGPAATAGTMVLIDDFGRGTCPKDAVALLGAAIRFFAAGGPSAPVVLCSTHFTELFQSVAQPLSIGDSRVTYPGNEEADDEADQLAFPFSDVAVYAMRCTAITRDAPTAQAGHPGRQPLCAVATDVVPTFEPTRITDSESLRTGLGAWCVTSLGGGAAAPQATAMGPSVARSCGLDSAALGLWVETLATLQGGGSPAGDRPIERVAALFT